MSLKTVIFTLFVLKSVKLYSLALEGNDHKLLKTELITIEQIKQQSVGLDGGGNPKWTLFHMYGDAKCLDGSQPGYWISKGDGDGANKFIIHHMGGGWCTSLENCYSRATDSQYGSSKDWIENVVCETDTEYSNGVKGPSPTSDKGSVPCNADGGMRGLLSPFPNENPLTYNWNKVFIGYCDGGSFGGNVEKPVSVNKNGKEEVFFKGKVILDAVYDSLLDKQDMKKATDVIVSGSSAGGLTVFMHIDYLTAKIKKESIYGINNIAGIADAGYFLDTPSISGEYRMQKQQGFVDMYTFQNLKGSLNPKCISDYDGKGEGWKCMLPQYSLKYITTPIFIVQSFADAYQIPNVMGISCSKHSCSSEDIKYVNKFRAEMVKSIEKSLPDNSGFWVTDCPVHTIADHSNFWVKAAVDKIVLKNAVFGWYYETFSVQGRKGHPLIERGSHTKDWQFVAAPWEDAVPECQFIEESAGEYKD